MDKQPLSDIQQQILAYIQDSYTRRQYAPSLAEMGEYFHMSAANVRYHLREMETKGHIYRPIHPGGRARSRVILVKEDES